MEFRVHLGDSEVGIPWGKHDRGNGGTALNAGGTVNPRLDGCGLMRLRYPGAVPPFGQPRETPPGAHDATP